MMPEMITFDDLFFKPCIILLYFAISSSEWVCCTSFVPTCTTYVVLAGARFDTSSREAITSSTPPPGMQKRFLFPGALAQNSVSCPLTMESPTSLTSSSSSSDRSVRIWKRFWQVVGITLRALGRALFLTTWNSSRVWTGVFVGATLVELGVVPSRRSVMNSCSASVVFVRDSIFSFAAFSSSARESIFPFVIFKFSCSWSFSLACFSRFGKIYTHGHFCP